MLPDRVSNPGPRALRVLVLKVGCIRSVAYFLCMEIPNITEMTKIKRHRYIKIVCPSVRFKDHSSATETGILASF